MFGTRIDEMSGEKRPWDSGKKRLPATTNTALISFKMAVRL
jgi:hypothetical protein